ncbi:MAG: hypothetical protein AABM67_20220 [Acidobacteriota bacterium]
MKSTKASSIIFILVWLACFSGCAQKGSKSAAANASSSAGQISKPSSDSPSSATGGSETTGDHATGGNQIVDQLHTPAKGTEERQTIMDALRAAFDNRQSPYYTSHRGAITFVVNRLQVHNGWAWMLGYPQSSDSQDSFGEYSGFLLHSVDSKWSVMRLPPMVNDPNDPENLDYPSRKDVEKIIQKYPTAPADIFSK